MKKRISAILLAIAVMVTATPMLAFADVEEQPAGDGSAAVMDTTTGESTEEEEEAVITTEPEEEEEAVVTTEPEEEEEVVVTTEPEEEEEAVVPAEPEEESAVEAEPAAKGKVMLKSAPKVTTNAAGDEGGNGDANDSESEDQNPPADPPGEEALSLSVSDLKATDITKTSVTLTWQLKNGDAVYTKNSKADLNVLVNGKKSDASIKFASGVYTVKVSKLTALTKYTFTVKIKDGKSADVTAKTKSDKPAVAGLKSTAKTSRSVKLTWQLKIGEDVYKKNATKKITVYTGKKARKTTIKFASSKAKYTTEVTGLKPGTTYTFKVSWKTAKGTVYKKIKVKTKKEFPQVKGFKALSDYNGVILNWKRVKGANGYIIKWNAGKKKGKFKVKGGKNNQYIHSLPENLRRTKIKYTIVAYNSKGQKSAVKSEAIGEAVRTMHIAITFATDRTLTSHDKKPVTMTFARGTTVNAFGYDGNRYHFMYKGHLFFVVKASIVGQTISEIDLNKTYSKKEAENFVNKLGLGSSTVNLIWVNTYTQSLYVFKGSKGKWKVEQGAWDVSTGLPKTPTPTGTTRVGSKSRGCYDPFPQTPWWCVCRAGFSIHGKAPYYPAMGAPASHGCVRNWSENAKWMYEHIPVNTTVHVF